MTEEQLNMLHEVSVLLGQMRKVAERASVIKTFYSRAGVSEKNNPPEKNEQGVEKNDLLLKKILGEMDIIQDVTITSSVRVKKICRELDPSVEI